MTDAPNNAQRLFHVFEKMFPTLAGAVTRYSAVRHTLRMQTTAHITLIFTYKGNKKWCLKTEKWDEQ